MSAVTAFNDWVAKARGVKLAAELERRGIKLKGGRINRAGACPKCGGSDRFGVNLKKGVWHCRGCGTGGDAIALVQHLDGVDFAAACGTLAGPLGASKDKLRSTQRRPIARNRQRSMARIWRGDSEQYEREQHQKARWLWGQHQPIAGTPAEVYLRDVRKISCALPATLGYLAPTKPGRHPALIAAFAVTDEIEPGLLAAPHDVASVHLTLLRADGAGRADAKPSKLMIGSPGALPIVIAPANDLLGLAVTEGLEDGLTVHAATGLGVWAAASAGRMPALAEQLPDYVEAITIYGHDDEAGQRGARGLAEKLAVRGITQILVEDLSRCP
jgi:phage/plasmid primase-like uncharacterized protein